MAYEELSRMKWTGKLDGCMVTIVHRGAPENEKVIHGSQITEIHKGYFLYADERSGDVHIPMHRVLRIESEGKVLWMKRKPQT